MAEAKPYLPAMQTDASMLHPVLRLDSQKHNSVIELPEFRRQVDELKQLQAGWYDGVGVAPSHLGLDWLTASFEAFYPDDLPLPYLFGTPEGRALAEWTLKPWAVSLEVDLQTYEAEWHALNLDTDAEDEEHYDLNKPDAWQHLSEKIRGYLGEPA